MLVETLFYLKGFSLEELEPILNTEVVYVYNSNIDFNITIISIQRKENTLMIEYKIETTRSVISGKDYNTVIHQECPNIELLLRNWFNNIKKGVFKNTKQKEYGKGLLVPYWIDLNICRLKEMVNAK